MGLRNIWKLSICVFRFNCKCWYEGNVNGNVFEVVVF